MKILAIETSMGRTSVALAWGAPHSSMLVDYLPSGERQAEDLIPLIGKLMAEAGGTFAALDRVAVCIGPGGFSGIRTGVAAARAIGLAANVEVAGATSFKIMACAFECIKDEYKNYGLAARAGVSAVFCQLFSRGRKPLSEIVALPQAETAAFFNSRAEVLAGPAAAFLHEAEGVSLPFCSADVRPSAPALLKIAPGLDPASDLPSPLYVRPPDARPQTGRVIPRQMSDERSD